MSEQAATQIFLLVGGTFDGETVAVHGTPAEAEASVEKLLAQYRARNVRYLGARAGGVFESAVPTDELPNDLAEMVREREARLAKVRSRRPKTDQELVETLALMRAEAASKRSA